MFDETIIPNDVYQCHTILNIYVNKDNALPIISAHYISTDKWKYPWRYMIQSVNQLRISSLTASQDFIHAP